MKKSKLILVVLLALVLCVACISVPTFSWYERPKEQGANKLSWNPEYEISTGEGISMITYESNDDGITYSKEVAQSGFTADLAPGAVKYYRTAIKNSNTVGAQNVSLYLSQLNLGENPNSKLFLGVNGPLRTYKKCSNIPDIPAESKVASEINKQHVYIGLHNDEMVELTQKGPGVHSWGSGDYDAAWSAAKDTSVAYNWDVGYWSSPQEFNVYAFEISSKSTNFMIKCSDDYWGNSAQPNIAENNTIAFFQYSNEYHEKAVNIGPNAKLETFYSSAKVEVGETLDIHATGNNISYESSNNSVASITDDGVVTGVKGGTATITATSTGPYGDTITSVCTVTVVGGSSSGEESFDFPIVVNYKIAQATDEEQTIEYVYWYIKNEDSSTKSYSSNGLYLSL